jgi:hypothetical protein
MQSSAFREVYTSRGAAIYKLNPVPGAVTEAKLRPGL